MWSRNSVGDAAVEPCVGVGERTLAPVASIADQSHDLPFEFMSVWSKLSRVNNEIAELRLDASVVVLALAGKHLRLQTVRHEIQPRWANF